MKLEGLVALMKTFRDMGLLYALPKVMVLVLFGVHAVAAPKPPDGPLTPRVALAADYPGGNGRLVSVDAEKRSVIVATDPKGGTDYYWFNFELSGLTPGRWRIQGLRLTAAGPAVSEDHGKTWRFLSPKGDAAWDEFIYEAKQGVGSVRFALSVPYQLSDWKSLMSSLPVSSRLHAGVLCRDRSGREVPMLEIAPEGGRAKMTMLYTARHHCCEVSASHVLEGIVRAAFSGTKESRWVAGNARVVVVPFMDLDGVENGEQGKKRPPHDHNRDYVKGIYPTVRALKKLVAERYSDVPLYFVDLHAPDLRGWEHDHVYTIGPRDKVQIDRWNAFRRALESATATATLRHDPKWDIPFGAPWNDEKSAAVERQGLLPSRRYFERQPNAHVSFCIEFGYGLCGGVFSHEGAVELGANVLRAQVSSVMSDDIVIYDGETTWTDKPLVFDGPWNFTSNGTISVELENTSDVDEVRLSVELTGQHDSRCRMTMIPPGFKGVIDIDVCPRIDHPEVAARMKLMRTTPFMGGDRDKPIDPSHVPSIRLEHYWSGASTAAKGAVPAVIVRRVVAKDTSAREWPAWYRMEADSFFPFVDRYGQFKHRDWPRKVTSDADLRAAGDDEARDLSEHPGGADWDEYGGWEKGPRLAATGRFRLEKVDGKWWFVDPNGRLWWSHGVVRVTPSTAVTPLDGREDYFAELPKDDGADPFGVFYHTYDELLKPYYDKKGWKRTYDFSAANLLRKYGSDWRKAFADVSHRRLRSWGLNTIANSSDRDIRLMNRTPWIERLETRGPQCKEQKGSGWWWHVPDPYHPEFRRYFRSLLESRRVELMSPWCVGVFVDNEHAWEGIRDETVREYFKVIREEISRLDPNLLYFGCRFSGYTEQVVRACAEYADAISYNPYRFRLDGLRLPAGVDKPILVGEFHFGSSADTGLFNPSLVPVNCQRDRARAYERYVMDALVHPNVVGTHWHQFSDQPVTGRFDGENFNVGFTDICDTPYPEMRTILRKVGETMYETRFGGQRVAPE